jgi:hypothetical protein
MGQIQICDYRSTKNISINYLDKINLHFTKKYCNTEEFTNRKNSIETNISGLKNFSGFSLLIFKTEELQTLKH